MMSSKKGKKSNHKEWVFEKVLEKRYNEKFERDEFKVKWKGSPETSWEPIGSFNPESYPSLVKLERKYFQKELSEKAKKASVSDCSSDDGKSNVSVVIKKVKKSDGTVRQTSSSVPEIMQFPQTPKKTMKVLAHEVMMENRDQKKRGRGRGQGSIKPTTSTPRSKRFAAAAANKRLERLAESGTDQESDDDTDLNVPVKRPKKENKEAKTTAVETKVEENAPAATKGRKKAEKSNSAEQAKSTKPEAKVDKKAGHKEKVEENVSESEVEEKNRKISAKTKKGAVVNEKSAKEKGRKKITTAAATKETETSKEDDAEVIANRENSSVESEHEDPKEVGQVIDDQSQKTNTSPLSEENEYDTDDFSNSEKYILERFKGANFRTRRTYPQMVEYRRKMNEDLCIHQRVYAGPRMIENAKIIMIHFALSPPDDLTDIRSKQKWCLNAIGKIQRIGCNVIIIKALFGDTTNPLFLHFLDMHDIMTVIDVEGLEFDKLCKLSGVSPLESLDFTPENLVTAKLVKAGDQNESEFVEIIGITRPCNAGEKKNIEPAKKAADSEAGDINTTAAATKETYREESTADNDGSDEFLVEEAKEKVSVAEPDISNTETGTFTEENNTEVDDVKNGKPEAEASTEAIDMEVVEDEQAKDEISGKHKKKAESYDYVADDDDDGSDDDESMEVVEDEKVKPSKKVKASEPVAEENKQHIYTKAKKAAEEEETAKCILKKAESKDLTIKEEVPADILPVKKSGVIEDESDKIIPYGITMPFMLAGFSQLSLIQWVKQEGETIKPDEVICILRCGSETKLIKGIEELILAQILVPNNSHGVLVGTLIGIAVKRADDLNKVKKFDIPFPALKFPRLTLDDSIDLVYNMNPIEIIHFIHRGEVPYFIIENRKNGERMEVPADDFVLVNPGEVARYFIKSLREKTFVEIQPLRPVVVVPTDE